MNVHEEKSYLSPLITVTLVIINLIAIGVSIWIWRDVRHDRIKDLSSVFSVLDKYYELTFYQRELSLKSVGFRLLDFDGNNADSLRWAFARNALNTYNDLLAFGLANSEGQLITFTGADYADELPDLMASEQSRRSFIEARESDKMVIGEAYFFDEIGEWILPLRVAIRDDSGDLLAVNTSAIDLNRLVNDLKSFGFHPWYQFHVINETFETTQFYYPLKVQDYKGVLGQDARIYDDVVNLVQLGGKIYFEATNTLTSKRVIGIQSTPDILNSRMVVSVDKAILWADFKGIFGWVLSIYVLAIVTGFVYFNILRRKEKDYLHGLRSERDFSSTVIQRSPSMIVGIRPDGICSYANPTTLKVTGYEHHELIGKNWFQLLYPSNKYSGALQQFVEMKKRSIQDSVSTLVTKTGEDRVIIWNSINLKNSKGELSEIIGFGNDITELRAAQEEIKQHTQNLETLVEERTKELNSSNRKLKNRTKKLEAALKHLKTTQNQLIHAEKMASLGVLSAGVAHEINNPLNFIKNGIEGVDEMLKLPEKPDYNDVEPFIIAIQEGASRASNIVKSLGQFSRQDSEMTEQCDVHRVLENCLTILKSSFRDKITLKRNYTGEGATILGNEGKLHQIFLNVLTNAEQAIVGLGTIEIMSSAGADHVEIRIIDDGVGIPKKIIKKISDPFFTTKPVGEGTGLGLSITYALVKEHGGSIDFISEIGQGTSVIITLPRIPKN